MDALATPEPSPDQVRRRRERRILAAVMALLLATTALVSPLAFGRLELLFLYILPFVLFAFLAVILGPLSAGAVADRAEREQAAALRARRQAAAARHAIATPPRNTLPPDDPEALAAAVAMAAQHGIHLGSSQQTDEDFLQSFHAAEIQPSNFRHGDHLRYTVLMLQRVPAGLAAQTIAGHLRTYLRQACGSEALFHATRTHAWVHLLRVHLQAAGPVSFAQLLLQHAPELHGSALSAFYSDAMLTSEQARQKFVEPDRVPLPQLYAPIRRRT
ncbi:hypothetical protein [Terriglobus aquaticus]|uniref:Uncharacterized protein n=1 Tax=Terriglobus aquaticus TaxID=940139 RepID=A0ABW9KQF0_9BACT|nr:hypothetical protein [Terriglobus aquaticus]